MKVITSIESTTRVFSVEDNDIYYKVRLSKDPVFYQWDIEGENGEVIDINSGLGNNLIEICEEYFLEQSWKFKKQFLPLGIIKNRSYAI